MLQQAKVSEETRIQFISKRAAQFAKERRSSSRSRSCAINLCFIAIRSSGFQHMLFQIEVEIESRVKVILKSRFGRGVADF